MNSKINILGTEYTISESNMIEDSSLNKWDGYTDRTSHKIVIDDMRLIDLDDVEDYRKETIRHEIIHAFFYECGISKIPGSIHSEDSVEWIASQFPKLLEAFKAAGAL